MDPSRKLEVTKEITNCLRQWYVVECRSQKEIGDLLGVGVAVVRRLFNQCSIRTRSKAEAGSDQFRNKPRKNARPTRSCVICGAPFRAPARSRREKCSRSCSVSVRNLAQGEKTIAAIETRFSEPISALLQRWHWEEKKTNKEISALVGVSSPTVHRWFRRFGISHRDKPEAMKLLVGPKHSVWKGGIKHPYGNDFIETSLRAKIRDRWTCQLCGVKGLPKKHYNAHHIIPFRESRDNSLENLVTLCIACHGKTEQAYKKRRGTLTFRSSQDLWNCLVVLIK